MKKIKKYLNALYKLSILIISVIFGILALIYIIGDNNYQLGYTLMNSSLLCYIISENINYTEIIINEEDIEVNNKNI